MAKKSLNLPATLDGIREFVKEFPTNGITSAWKDMLYDLDKCDEDYEFNDFILEAEEMYQNLDLMPRSANTLLESFPRFTFEFDERQLDNE